MAELLSSSARLAGHRGAVLCLDAPRTSHQSINQSGHPPVLVSGGEDGSVRLWDLATGRAARAIVLPGAPSRLSPTAASSRAQNISIHATTRWLDIEYQFPLHYSRNVIELSALNGIRSIRSIPLPGNGSELHSCMFIHVPDYPYVQYYGS